ncbi:MAG: energy transducer TonB [Flavobacteriaceae bacterium]|nr:MAG: energy transducer TonB [Flavobacteriaceae bacterium]
MKKLLFFLVICPFLLFGNDIEIPSKIKEVTVYLNSAQIRRSVNCNINAGITKIDFIGLSTKIDESSIQISGLQYVSILSMAYDIDYLVTPEVSPEINALTNNIEALEMEIALLKNTIIGLEEEELVITTNRAIGSRSKDLDLERVKQISTYYRQRITQIKNETFTTNLKINSLKADIRAHKNQLAELNNAPVKEHGKISITFDSPIPASLNLKISYAVQDAGWIPTYDIKSKKINAPLNLTYKAHVYQKTGVNWDKVKVVLSTGNPNINIAKPVIGSKYLNFVSGYKKRYMPTPKTQGYVHNPMVKQVMGIVTDESGVPLPGCNVTVEGATRGTTTDFDGQYSLNVAQGQELVFSYIGFHNKQMPIYSSIMNIRLDEDIAALEEVVLVGYGTSSRSYTTGALSSVVAERALQGKSAGVQIRGASSYRKVKSPAPKLPLYVVDGVPMEGFIDGDLDENEIQHIEVLKGQNTTAIYGSKGMNNVVLITTKKSKANDTMTSTEFDIKKPYSILSDGDITAIEINTHQLNATYEYFAAPILNENVFLTVMFNDWEQFNLLPGEANLYFEGGYAGKTTIDPYTTTKEMTVSLGIDPNITVTRKQDKNFKSKSFTGGTRILDRTYVLEVKNNKNIAINLKLMDRIPLSQNKEIKVDHIETYTAAYEQKKGLLTWTMKLNSQETKKETFSFQVKYPKYKRISL